MSHFFDNLVSENLFQEWASTLDWLFDDLKFSTERNWNSGYTSSYTRRIKRLKYLSDKEKRVIYGKIDYKSFPNQEKGRKKKRAPYIAMTGSNRFARDLVRHIRNGIAHGQTAISRVGPELYIEIMDYSDKSKTPEKQTAYLFLPLSYICSFCTIYNEINLSIIRTKPKDRIARKKYK